MNNAYADITMSTGPHTGGTCSFKMASREWLTAAPVQNFNTGVIDTAIDIGSHSWIEANCVFDTMELQQKQKQNRTGIYFTHDLSGVINTDDATTLQLLETYGYHEWVVIYKDKKGQQRLIGDFENGLFFSNDLKHITRGGGQSFYEVSLYFESPNKAPFYKPA